MEIRRAASAIPLLPQVQPLGIICLDQRELPFPASLLDQLLTGDGWLDFLMAFSDVHPAARFHAHVMPTALPQEKPSPVSSTGDGGF